MLKLIRCYKENGEWIYVTNVYIKDTAYIARSTKILEIKTIGYVKENFRKYTPQGHIQDEVDWAIDLMNAGFGEYEYYDPSKIRKPRKKRRLTRKDRIKQKVGQFKKSLIKRSKEQYQKDKDDTNKI